MERNHSIDCLKALCAFFVVVIHGTIFGKEYFEPVTRCAVPCFFIISGWFIYSADLGKMRERLMKSIKRVGWILLWSTVLFAVVKLGSCYLHDDFSCWRGSIKYFLLFNPNPFYYHLWYLAAYLYVLIIVFLLARYWKISLLKYATPTYKFDYLYYKMTTCV